MAKPIKKIIECTMSDVLRQTILEAEVPLLVLERDTGVQRASLRRFLRRETSLHLDIADRLATYFGLKLVPTRKTTKAASRRKGK